MPENHLDEEYGKIAIVIIAAVAVMALVFFLTQPANRAGLATETASVSGELTIGSSENYELLGEKYEVAFVSAEDDISAGDFTLNGVAAKSLAEGDSFAYDDVTFVIDKISSVPVDGCQEKECPPLIVADFTITKLPPPPSPDEPATPSYVKIGDVLQEGETKTYTIDGHDYEITLVFVSGEERAKFMINGALSPILSESEGYLFGPRLYLEAKDILVGGVDSTVDFQVYDQWYAPNCVNLESAQIAAIGPDKVCCVGEVKPLPLCRDPDTKPVEPTPLTCGDRYITCEGAQLISYPVGKQGGAS